MSESPSYSPLSSKESEDTEAPLLDLDHHASMARVRKVMSSRQTMHWFFHCVGVIAIAGLLLALERLSRVNQGKCFDMFNYYSPVNDAVKPHLYVHQQFNGSLWYQSPFKGPPTPEVEQAWYDVMKYGMISVSREDIEKIQHPDWSAQFPPEAGGGYIAATIGSHQVHCLHYIWQDHHMEYFPETQDKKARVPELYERHYEHCVDYIRQSLMCQFDTGIIPYNWVLDHQNPTPNANTHHKCVDWSALQSWLKDRVVEVPEGFVWSQPEDAVSLDYNP